MKSKWLIMTHSEDYIFHLKGFTAHQKDELVLCVESQFGVKELKEGKGK